MKVHVPRRPRSAKSKAFQRAIDTTSSKLRYSPSAVEQIASQLFEAIADEVRNGNAVLIRGFGLFGSRRFRPPGDPHGHPVPSFAPARGFRHELRLSFASTDVAEADLKRYRRANRIGTAKGRSHERTWAIQDEVRRKIMAANDGRVELD